jgi:ribosomal protein S18 acetylase RimI-like enzyme
LWVEPAQRGCGLGRQLLLTAEREAEARDCRLMVAFTHEHQAPGFYERCGYELVGRVDGYPAGSAAHWFRKRLWLRQA